MGRRPTQVNIGWSEFTGLRNLTNSIVHEFLPMTEKFQLRNLTSPKRALKGRGVSLSPDRQLSKDRDRPKLISRLSPPCDSPRLVYQADICLISFIGHSLPVLNMGFKFLNHR